MKVFLGGTCNESTWRDKMIDVLEINYFNPVVDDWNEEAYQQELLARKTCDFCLYTITAKMTGVYSIAEVVDDSNKRPEKTILVISNHDGLIEAKLDKSLHAVAKMVQENGGKVFFTLNNAAKYMNRRK